MGHFIRRAMAEIVRLICACILTTSIFCIHVVVFCSISWSGAN